MLGCVLLLALAGCSATKSGVAKAPVTPGPSGSHAASAEQAAAPAAAPAPVERRIDPSLPIDSYGRPCDQRSEPLRLGYYPRFTTAAREAGYREGWVVVRYDIAAGRPRHPVVAAASPPGLFDAEALQAVRHMQFGPDVNAHLCVTKWNFRLGH